MVGYLLHRASTLERIVLVAAAVTLIKPGLWTDLAGLGMVAAVLAIQIAQQRSVAARQAAAE